MDDRTDKPNPLSRIRHLDYTVIYARDMPAMRRFYERAMAFPLYRELGPQWVEYRVGASILALTERGLMFDDPAPPEWRALTPARVSRQACRGRRLRRRVARARRSDVEGTY